MSKSERQIRIGTGAGMADDRITPAIQLLETNTLDYLVCECLAERTIARETQTKRKNDQLGYTPMLQERLAAFLPLCRQHKVRLVTNMGAANPVSAAKASCEQAAEIDWKDFCCAAVTGDDVTERIAQHPELPLRDSGQPLETILSRLVSANAYLGADAVKDALDTGADAVVTGRVADPSLFLGVALHHFGWSNDDLPRLAAGTMMGHLLECSVQVTGGYFADPGKKDVSRLSELPYPFADISSDGELYIGKPDGSGGRLDRLTCSEQALYEIHDPRNYITPDCVLDIEGLNFLEISPDRVGVSGMSAKEPTDSYKVVVGYTDGWIGSGEVSYAGINAVARAKLAAEIVVDRFKREGGRSTEFLVNMIGMNSLHGDGTSDAEPYEVRLRVAARCEDKKSADLLGNHVRQLNMQGPYAAGGPINVGAKEILAVDSVLIPRDWVSHQVTTLKA